MSNFILSFALVLIIGIIFGILFFHLIRHIRLIHKKIYITKMNRAMAEFGYELVLFAYDSLMEIRSQYYQTHFIEDEKIKQEEQERLKENYDFMLSILEYPNYEEIEPFLDPYQRKCLDETLARPRYKLI